jgi:lysyl-tRNA synthetase class 1
MAIEIPDALETAFQNADQSPGRLDLLALRSQLAPTLTDLPRERPEVRKGLFVLVAALDFQPVHTYGEPVWEMHWQPLSSAVDVAGNVHHAPEALVVDAEIIEQWRERAQAARHPVLRARFADLAWEIAAFRQELAIRPNADSARIAIDGYLDAVEQHRTGDDFDAWNDLGRAVELAARIKDAARLQRAKQVLFDFRADCEARDPTYAFWKFDEIVWVQRRPLGLDDGERTIIVDALERQLAQRSRIENPRGF